jgi:hypothetical protein
MCFQCIEAVIPFTALFRILKKQKFLIIIIIFLKFNQGIVYNRFSEFSKYQKGLFKPQESN